VTYGCNVSADPPDRRDRSGASPAFRRARPMVRRSAAVRSAWRGIGAGPARSGTG